MENYVTITERWERCAECKKFKYVSFKFNYQDDGGAANSGDIPVKDPLCADHKTRDEIILEI